jgi:hypothetical protein
MCAARRPQLLSALQVVPALRALPLRFGLFGLQTEHVPACGPRWHKRCDDHVRPDHEAAVAAIRCGSRPSPGFSASRRGGRAVP